MVTALKRICCRCGATFSVDKSGKHTRREECNYHYGKVIENRGKNGLECLYFFFLSIKNYYLLCMSSLIVPGGVETRYSCCENAVGSPGCQVFNVLLFMLKLYSYTCVLLEGLKTFHLIFQWRCYSFSPSH